MSSLTTSNNDTGPSAGIYYRLIALWVLCEAMLGGIIHGFRIPVSGLFVGSSAVVCICLIAFYVPARGAIIKATLIVAIFKMMLSPQAPPPAYIAVFFQGAIAELLFLRRRWYAAACVLLAVLSLLESGLQRILMLTVIYGNDLWKAINSFISGLVGKKSEGEYSRYIITGYVLLHLLTGLIVGYWAATLPGRINRLKKEFAGYKIEMDNTAIFLPPPKRKRRRKVILLIVWLLLIGLYIQSYYNIGSPLLPAHISLRILIRSVIIVFSWYLIAGPLLKQLLNNWLQKKRRRWQREIEQIICLLPLMEQLVIKSWQQAKVKKGLKRLGLWVRIVLVNTVEDPEDKTSERTAEHGSASSGLQNFFILTGAIHSGKTTALINWSVERQDVAGILTPVVEGKRMFMNAKTKEQFNMEATGNEEVLSTGKYQFSKNSFEKATAIIRQATGQDGWLIIDEIGPLELRGEGFADILKELLVSRRGNTILVAREGLAEKVTSLFGIRSAIHITKEDLQV
jgi:nucleoside-triphosphatase THEP1